MSPYGPCRHSRDELTKQVLPMVRRRQKSAAAKLVAAAPRDRDHAAMTARPKMFPAGLGDEIRIVGSAVGVGEVLGSNLIRKNGRRRTLKRLGPQPPCRNRDGRRKHCHGAAIMLILAHLGQCQPE